ncbi:hypothetical protein SCLCIDRAFT_28433 [Scleroderma citrinum Foug A]|uniref:Uncharacterized protein n=1 Tax=Scleroderma citrinum Foug A TaxID=1036808 RepID=A0A0C2Z7E1_9AGAM|nr:hypothetical protein SCLCIDRAFT_28433 [Scleroderma citrinum Foug A]
MASTSGSGSRSSQPSPMNVTPRPPSRVIDEGGGCCGCLGCTFAILFCGAVSFWCTLSNVVEWQPTHGDFAHASSICLVFKRPFANVIWVQLPETSTQPRSNGGGGHQVFAYCQFEARGWFTLWTILSSVLAHAAALAHWVHVCRLEQRELKKQCAQGHLSNYSNIFANALQVACLHILCPSSTLSCFPPDIASPSSLFQPPISNLPVESPPSTVSQQGTIDPYLM